MTLHRILGSPSFIIKEEAVRMWRFSGPSPNKTSGSRLEVTKSHGIEKLLLLKALMSWYKVKTVIAYDP